MRSPFRAPTYPAAKVITTISTAIPANVDGSVGLSPMRSVDTCSGAARAGSVMKRSRHPECASIISRKRFRGSRQARRVCRFLSSVVRAYSRRDHRVRRSRATTRSTRRYREWPARFARARAQTTWLPAWFGCFAAQPSNRSHAPRRLSPREQMTEETRHQVKRARVPNPSRNGKKTTPGPSATNRIRVFHNPNDFPLVPGSQAH